jgi:Flp pilus assembly protein TadG
MLKLRGLRDLIRDRRGNMLMLFAFAVIPITFATGMGIDYAGAMRLQTRLNAVTDAAALAAVTTPMMRQRMDAACTAARATFASQVTGITGLTINAAQQSDVAISITDTLAIGGDVTVNCTTLGTLIVPLTLPISRTAVVTYKARSTNNFSAILGSSSLGIGGTATSKATLAPYIDIHLALDTSQSMGLAASDQAARDLWQKTGELNGRSCQFGCHERSPGETYSNEDIANTYNIPLRVNVLRDATIDMIDTASSNQGTANNYQFALYRIGKNNGRWMPGIDRYVPLTNDLATVRSKVQALRLSPNDGAVGFGDTDLPSTASTILPFMNATSAVFDDGTTQAKARKYLFMVTDGVTDTEGWLCTYGHCTSPINPATCDAYKAKGVTVGIVYTTYLPTRANPMNPNDLSLRDEYIKLIQPIANNIRPNLQQCASSGWFFEASDQATIHSAMQTLFRQATQTPALIR